MLKHKFSFHQAYSKHHDKPFNPNTFNWKEESNILAAVYHKHFKDWWDPAKFVGNSYILMKNCNEYFKEWWPTAHGDLSQYELIIFCGKHLPIWWDDIEFKWNTKSMTYLDTHCKEHRNIWLADAIIYKLSNE